MFGQSLSEAERFSNVRVVQMYTKKIISLFYNDLLEFYFDFKSFLNPGNPIFVCFGPKIFPNVF